MSTTPPQYFDLIESAIAGSKNDLRTLLQQLSANDTQQQAALGLPSSTTNQNAKVPSQAAISAVGSNGAFNVTVTPGSSSEPGTVWHEITSSPVKGFTSGVAVEALTTATNVVVNKPGQNLFFRVRSSYNKAVFNQPTLSGQSASSSGLVSSAATNSAGSFNQTNLGTVTSVSAGATAAIQVQGAGGVLSSMVAVKGSTQSVLPGATIVGVTPGSTNYVGYDNEAGSYAVRPTLASVMADGMTPVGVVSAVETGGVDLPTIQPVEVAGAIVAYNVTSPGNGLTQPVDIIVEGTGTGATTGTQTITAGKLIAVAPGNPGTGYGSGTTAFVSGGVFKGSTGGGTADGNNGGRLIPPNF